MRADELVKRLLAMGLTRFESFELISHFCGMGKSDILLGKEADERLCMEKGLDVARGKPLQYVLGEWDFLGRRIICREGVLIPREDTETLVYQALKYIKEGDRVCDLCCGSGCISVALAQAGASVTALDINEEAVRLTKDNALLWGVKVDAGRCDVLREDISGEFDMLVSNPPYIRSTDIRRLDDSVRKFEPRAALDGGKDGLVFYKSILSRNLVNLKSGGRILFEIGFDQAEAVALLMREAGLADISLEKDGNQKDRVLCGRKI